MENFRTIRQILAGERGADEQTFASVSILQDRLKRLQKLDKAFCGVAFSPDVEKLSKRNNRVAVC